MFLLANCLKHGLEKEQELPRILNMAINYISGQEASDLKSNHLNKKMRSAEEILKDYGLSPEQVGLERR